MYPQQFLTTPRLTTAYYRAGEEGRPKLLLLHGNISSSDFFLPLFPALAERFDVAAPDLRCFGDSSALPIDATRTYRDWSDDVAEFVAALGWDRFVLGGWSMGGCVAMQYAIDHGEQLDGLLLINPGSPFGFGGSKDVEGTVLEPAGLASGGGCVNPQLVQALIRGDREFVRVAMNNANFTPGFRLEPAWEQRLIDGRMKTKVGEGMYPGSSRKSTRWPYVVSGDKGVCNTMSPAHGNLAGLADIPAKPPVLWVRGAADVMVSDTSSGDFGFLGQCGIVPGWPGAEVIPPQPMVAQTRYVLDRYAANGGTYQERVLPGGHGCFLENADDFVAAVMELFAGA